jgi:hypothetical protein
MKTTNSKDVLIEKMKEFIDNMDATVSICQDVVKGELSPCVVCTGCETENDRCPCGRFCLDVENAVSKYKKHIYIEVKRDENRKSGI